MLKNNLLVYIISFILLFSCKSQSGQDQKISRYFDLQGLVKQQTILLDSLMPKLHKKTNLEGTEEEKTILPDSATWAKELDIFLQADINQPRLVDVYAINEDLKNGYRVTTYTAVEPIKKGVNYLYVYRGDENEIYKVEICYQEKNIIYFIQRNLALSFEKQEDGEVFLASYGITGKQKMLFRDTVFYKVDTNLLY